MKYRRKPLLRSTHKESSQIDKDLIKRARLVLSEYKEYDKITHLQRTLNISLTKAAELYRAIERDIIGDAVKELIHFRARCNSKLVEQSNGELLREVDRKIKYAQKLLAK